MGFPGPSKHISFTVAYSFASCMELLQWLLGPWYHRWFRMPVTRHMVTSMALHHWFSHDRATRHVSLFLSGRFLDPEIAVDLHLSWCDDEEPEFGVVKHHGDRTVFPQRPRIKHAFADWWT